MKQLIKTFSIIILCEISCTYAQGFEQRNFFFGPAIEYGIPYRDLSNIGFAMQSEYMLSSSFGIIGEYSLLNYTGPDDQTSSINLDFNISAPAIFLCWHTPTKSTLEFFLAAGMGYTSISGLIGSTSFVLSSQGKNGIFLPQAKLGTRYWLTDQLALRLGIGFYRPLSFGVDYSL